VILLYAVFSISTVFILAYLSFNASTDFLSISIFSSSFCLALLSIYIFPPTPINTTNNKRLIITTIHFLFMSLILSFTFLTGIVISVFLLFSTPFCSNYLLIYYTYIFSLIISLHFFLYGSILFELFLFLPRKLVFPYLLPQ